MGQTASHEEAAVEHPSRHGDIGAGGNGIRTGFALDQAADHSYLLGDLIRAIGGFGEANLAAASPDEHNRRSVYDELMRSCVALPLSCDAFDEADDIPDPTTAMLVAGALAKWRRIIEPILAEQPVVIEAWADQAGIAANVIATAMDELLITIGLAPIGSD